MSSGVNMDAVRAQMSQKLKLMKAQRSNSSRGIENILKPSKEDKNMPDMSILKDLLDSKSVQEKKRLIQEILQNETVMAELKKRDPAMMSHLDQVTHQLKKTKKTKKRKNKTKNKIPHTTAAAERPEFKLNDVPQAFGDLLNDLPEQSEDTPKETLKEPLKEPIKLPVEIQPIIDAEVTSAGWGDLLSDLD